jgi:spore germination protein (amino acid permease)
MSDKGFIRGYGLFSTIIVTVIGVGVFSYPGSMTNIVGTDGWIVTLIAGVLVFLFMYLIYKAVKKNEYETFYIMLESNLGKILGKLFGFILCVYFIVSIAFGLRIFAEVIKMYLLQRTPTEFILIVMILTGLYLVRAEVSALVKFNEITFFIMFIPVIIVLLFSTRGGDITNILPVFQNKPVDYFRALGTSVYSFGGFEIAYLILPFMISEEKKGIPKTFLKAVIFITLFYTGVTILCLMFFSEAHTKLLLWPTITLIRAIIIPGAFIERWEGIVMTFWVLFYFTTFINIYYFSADIIKDAFKLQDIKISSIILTPIIYLVALYPENIAEVYDYSGKIVPLLSIFSFIILPLVLLLLQGRKGRRRNVNEA